MSDTRHCLQGEGTGLKTGATDYDAQFVRTDVPTLIIEKFRF